MLPTIVGYLYIQARSPAVTASLFHTALSPDFVDRDATRMLWIVRAVRLQRDNCVAGDQRTEPKAAATHLVASTIS
jgi:hypothetical protein